MIHFLRFSSYLILLVLTTQFVNAAEFERLSEVERGLVDAALSKFNLKIDLSPEGKRIGRFYVETKNPYSFDKGIFRILRKLHVKTKDQYLIDQLLMKPGDLFNERVITETEIRLNNIKIRSTALIFPVQPIGDESEETVDLLVVTRDVLSLQLLFDLNWIGDSLYRFTAGATEASIAGTNKLGSLSFQMRPFLMDISALYVDPDFLSTSHQFLAAQSLILSRENGSYEGVRGALRLDRVLYSEEQKWGYGIHFDYAYEPKFEYDNLDLRVVGFPRTRQRTQWKYRWLDVNGDISLTRSFGGAVKNNLTVGYGFGVKRPTLFEDFSLSGLPAQEYIERIVPIKEYQSFLQLSYQYFWNDFMTMYDFDTFALQEWQRLGPSLTLSNQIALGIFGSTYNFLRPILSASYTTSFGKSSLFRIRATVETRAEGKLKNDHVGADLLIVTPVIAGVGRLVAAGIYQAWFDDFNHHMYSLGGENGLRGVPLGAYLGNELIRANVEFRTKSVVFGVFRLGAVGFYDVGVASETPKRIMPTQDAGVGVRIQFLPFSRAVFRIDVAVPFSGPMSGWDQFQITFGTGQAF